MDRTLNRALYVTVYVPLHFFVLFFFTVAVYLKLLQHHDYAEQPLSLQENSGNNNTNLPAWLSPIPPRYRSSALRTRRAESAEHSTGPECRLASHRPSVFDDKHTSTTSYDFMLRNY